jgi:hypothetical protein
MLGGSTSLRPVLAKQSRLTPGLRFAPPSAWHVALFLNSSQRGPRTVTSARGRIAFRTRLCTWHEDSSGPELRPQVRPIIDHMPDRNAHDRHDEGSKKHYREELHGAKVTPRERGQVDEDNASAIRLADATGGDRLNDWAS